MPTVITTFLGNEEGATAVEYGLMTALIAAVIIVAVTAIGANMSAIFQNIADTISP
jgi:pilus assembly protein Flp/PilA